MSSTIGNDTYDSLSDIFANRKSDEVLEIEILSPALGPLLRDGLCIGVTKAALVKAFLIARKLLTSYLVKQNKNGTTSFGEPDGANEFDIATQILLLFDCEHVTACNWRKRYITSFIPKNVTESDTEPLKDHLQRERTLMTSFQCSPLHRHTKSPTLWQHRLWIMTKLLTLQEQIAVYAETTHDSLRTLMLEELDVICKSGQLHPRNYYAFSYMRQLHALVCQFSRSDSQALLLDLAIIMVEPMLKWCLSNPSDISGWMYLFYLLNHGNDPTYPSSSLEGRMSNERRLVMKQTIHFAVQIATWESESLWTFVDLMVAKFGFDILSTLDTTTSKPWNGSIASGARWKTTKCRVQKLFKRNS